MIALFYEPRHRVVLARVSGVLSSDDLDAHDRTLLPFLADKSDVRAIYDFSAVETLAIPASKIAQRGQRPAIITGRRVVVSADQAGSEFARIIADEQRAAGLAEPTIVPTLEEAYVRLGLGLDSSFEPVSAS